VHCEEARLVLDPMPGPRRSTREADRALEHLARCRSCQRFFEASQAIVSRLTTWARRTRTPQHLREGILTSLRGEERRRIRGRRLAVGGGGGLIAAGLLFVVLSGSPASRLAEPLAKEARIAVTTAAIAIESSDPAVVRQWLNAHVGFPIDLPSISGAVLTGARVVEWSGAPSAAIVYHYHGKPLTYFARSPEEPTRIRLGSGVVAVSADGFGVAVWTERGSPRAVAGPMKGWEVRAIAEECRRQGITPS